jgi:hypothetical protein
MDARLTGLEQAAAWASISGALVGLGALVIALVAARYASKAAASSVEAARLAAQAIELQERVTEHERRRQAANSLAELITFLPDIHSYEREKWAARTKLRAAAAGDDALIVVDEVARFEKGGDPSWQRVEVAVAEVLAELGYDGPAGP